MGPDPIRVYVDASVFGGCLDEEFEAASQTFFDQVRAGRFVVVSSAVVRQELGPAPEEVRRIYLETEPFVEFVEVTDAARRLQAAYLRAGIVGESGKLDALHVAIATVCRCQAIVSWNFRHIVHFEKIPLYNGVNLVEGYGPLGIHSPQEVVVYEGENEDV